jgi:Trm5-related predicted tRNA methylase
MFFRNSIILKERLFERTRKIRKIQKNGIQKKKNEFRKNVIRSNNLVPLNPPADEVLSVSIRQDESCFKQKVKFSLLSNNVSLTFLQL